MSGGPGTIGKASLMDDHSACYNNAITDLNRTFIEHCFDIVFNGVIDFINSYLQASDLQ